MKFSARKIDHNIKRHPPRPSKVFCRKCKVGARVDPSVRGSTHCTVHFFRNDHGPAENVLKANFAEFGDFGKGKNLS